METKYILSKEEFREFSVSSAYCEIILKMELQRQREKGGKNGAPPITTAQRLLIDEMDLHQLLKLLEVLAENIKELPDRDFARCVIDRIENKFSSHTATESS